MPQGYEQSCKNYICTRVCAKTIACIHQKYKNNSVDYFSFYERIKNSNNTLKFVWHATYSPGIHQLKKIKTIKAKKLQVNEIKSIHVKFPLRRKQ